MGHSSLEAAEASEIRVVCIGHLARVRSWLTAEGVADDMTARITPRGDAGAEAEEVPPCAGTSAARSVEVDAFQP